MQSFQIEMAINGSHPVCLSVCLSEVHCSVPFCSRSADSHKNTTEPPPILHKLAFEAEE